MYKITANYDGCICALVDATGMEDVELYNALITLQKYKI